MISFCERCDNYVEVEYIDTNYFACKDCGLEVYKDEIIWESDEEKEEYMPENENDYIESNYNALFCSPMDKPLQSWEEERWREL